MRTETCIDQIQALMQNAQNVTKKRVGEIACLGEPLLFKKGDV